MSRSAHTVTITLAGVDGTSQVFRVIGQSGQAMATQLDSAGKKSSAGLAQVDAAAKETSSSLKGLISTGRELQATSAAVGAGMATVAGLLSDAARAAAEEQVEFDRLQTAIEATGASFDDYAGSVDTAVKAAMALSFADDQTVNALNALVTTTGDTTKSVELLGLAMDLSRGRGIDLATAATIVGRVAAGNTTLLSRYGIVIKEGATATEALAQIQARFGGQAESYAQSQVGAATRVKNALDDMFESVGSSTGALQSLLLIMPGLSSTFSLFGGAVGGLTGALSPLTGGAVAGAGGVGALGVAAAAATPLILALAAAMHQGAEATATFNEETAKGAAFLERVGGQDDALLSDIINAFIRWNTVTTVTWHDTTLGLEQINRLLLSLDQTSVSALRHFVEAAGGITPENIDDIAQEVLRLHDVEQEWLATNLGLADSQRALLQQDMAQHFEETRAAAENVNAALDAHDEGLKSAAIAADQLIARERLLRESFSQNFVTPELPSLYRSPSEVQRDAASLTSASDRRAVDRAREQESVLRDQIAAVNDLASAEQHLTDATEQRDQALADQAALAADHERDLAQITKDRVQAQKAAEQDLAQTVRGLQQERERNERDLSQTLRQLEQERAQVAEETERQLADLAEQRGTVMADAAQQAAEAERDWLATSRDNLAQQAALRQQLQETTAQAAKAWADLNRENLAQQQEIRAELRRTLEEENIAFGREQDDIRREIAYTKEELQNAQGAGGGPYDAQAVADAKKRLEELNTELSRATQDHKREEADAKREARAQEKDLEDQRIQAMQDYHEKVRQAEADTAARIQDLEKNRLAAQQEYYRQQEDARNDAASQLADLAAQEQSILDAQGQKFAEIESQKRIAARDTAREQQKLVQETAKAERQAQADILAAQKDAAKQAREAELQYREDAADAATRVKETSDEANEAAANVVDQLAIVKKGAQGTVTVRTSQAMSNIADLRSELDDLIAQLEEDYSITLSVKRGDPEPLDGPVKNPNHIHGNSGVVVTPGIRAAMGRVVQVGETRPETLVLPFGSMVIPDGGERAKRESGSTIQYIFPNARFELRSADIAKEISRQLATRDR